MFTDMKKSVANTVARRTFNKQFRGQLTAPNIFGTKKILSRDHVI